MNLQRISEFAENQGGKHLFITYRAQKRAQLTSGSFRPDKLCEQRRFE
jgi:hypothetical protein